MSRLPVTRLVPPLLGVSLLTFPSGCAPEATDPAVLQLRWLGVSTWVLESDGQALLLDAFLSRPDDLGEASSTPEGEALLEEVLAELGDPVLSGVVIGHSHYDHALDAGALAARWGVPLLGTETTCLLAQAQGLRPSDCRVPREGELLQLDSWTLRALPSPHWDPEGAGRYDELKEPPEPEAIGLAPHGGVLTWLIEAAQEGSNSRVLFQDTLGPVHADDGSGLDYPALLEDFERSAGEGEAPLLWLGSPAFASSEEELRPYLSAFRPSHVLHHHWDGLWPLLDQGPALPYEAPEFLEATLEAWEIQEQLPDYEVILTWSPEEGQLR